MLFELRNASTDRVSHCGVLEFIAEEGLIYMPYWVYIFCIFWYLFFLSSGLVTYLIYSNVDDGKPAFTRGRRRETKKCDSSKGYIC